MSTSVSFVFSVRDNIRESQSKAAFPDGKITPWYHRPGADGRSLIFEII